jgi:hypothetical protein
LYNDKLYDLHFPPAIVTVLNQEDEVIETVARIEEAKNWFGHLRLDQRIILKLFPEKLFLVM